MFDTITQKYSLLIGDVCVKNSDEDWADDFKKQMADEGFTMAKGLMVSMSLLDPEQSRPIEICMVPVARRLSPIKVKPKTRHDAGRPKFMEHHAFFSPTSGFGWGSLIVNHIIGDNRGKLPAKWIAAAILNDS